MSLADGVYRCLGCRESLLFLLQVCERQVRTLYEWLQLVSDRSDRETNINQTETAISKIRRSIWTND